MTVKSIIIEVPENIAATLRIPSNKDIGKELKKELALHLYKEGILSLGNAMKLADMGIVEFHLLLGERKIPRHYGIDQYEEDIATVQSRLKAI